MARVIVSRYKFWTFWSMTTTAPSSVLPITTFEEVWQQLLCFVVVVVLLQCSVLCSVKGQLISKCLFGVIVSTKIATKIL